MPVLPQPINNPRYIGAFAIGIAASISSYAIFKYINKHNHFETASTSSVHPALVQPQSQLYQSIKQQQLSGTIDYFGPENFSKLDKSYVVVVGVGGVGSHVVNMLARSGVKRIRIIDFDRVSLSSLNRHAYSVRKDVGISKVQCIRQYIHQLLPHIEVECVEEYVTRDNIEKLIPLDASYVVDCIDNLDAKAALVMYCVEKKIRLVVSGGAGMKNDATRMQIRDIADARNDELLTSLRKRLYKAKIRSGVKVVFSHQEAEKELLPLNEQQEKDPQAFKVFDNYRIRIVPVLGTMPAMMGMTIASYVLCDLCDEKYDTYEAQDIRGGAYGKLFNQLLTNQRKLGLSNQQAQFDNEDVCLLVRHVFQWKCVITGKFEQKHPYMIRWKPQKKAGLFNIAFMSREAYEAHIKFRSLEEAMYPQSVYRTMEEKWALVRKLKSQKFIVYR